MSINYKPADGWAADFIPFYWQGEYHLFYLKDFRDPAGHGEGTPWCHLVTSDLVHFVDHGECLARGGPQDQDLYVFTGSVIHGEGRFHIFYTGHNPHLRQAGRPEQGIMHAVSDDLYTWNKVQADTFFAPPERFEPHDWRDPFVFWNAEAGEYWMLAAARLKQGPSRRRGCTALCASRDLVHWEVREPFYTPDLYFTHECPDLFRMGEWWYLLFSEFTDACVTRYRMARSLRGPWLTPAVDTFDGRALYAAKTASDGRERFLFGWNPTRVDLKDTTPWQWGGNLAVHQILQRPDGSLAVDIPANIAAAFSRPQPVVYPQAFKTALPAAGSAAVRLAGEESFRAISAGPLPACCKIDAVARWQPGTRAFGLLLRCSDLDTGYFLRFEPERGRLVFDPWPRPGDQPFQVEIERPIRLDPARALELSLYMDGSLLEVYADHEVAMSARMYEHASGEWGFFVNQGTVEFSAIHLTLPGEIS